MRAPVLAALALAGCSTLQTADHAATLCFALPQTGAAPTAIENYLPHERLSVPQEPSTPLQLEPALPVPADDGALGALSALGGAGNGPRAQQRAKWSRGSAALQGFLSGLGFVAGAGLATLGGLELWDGKVSGTKPPYNSGWVFGFGIASIVAFLLGAAAASQSGSCCNIQIASGYSALSVLGGLNLVGAAIVAGALLVYYLLLGVLGCILSG